MWAHFSRKLFLFIVYIWSIFLSNCGLGKHQNDIEAADQHFMVGAKVRASHKIYVAQPQSILKSLHIFASVDRLKKLRFKASSTAKKQTQNWNERQTGSSPHETNNSRWIKENANGNEHVASIDEWENVKRKRTQSENLLMEKEFSILEKLLWVESCSKQCRLKQCKLLTPTLIAHLHLRWLRLWRRHEAEAVLMH